jgi:Raf kinase inhibitor-like YbhB/YbcL family protein
MQLTSSAFTAGGIIPERYSQYGDNRSLPLDIADVPAATKSLVLIMDDPDAPRGLFTHWIVFNLGPLTRRIEEDDLPGDARLGCNDAGQTAYAGPKPPDREHRYFLRLYALDTRFDLPEGARRAEVEKEMSGRIIATAELMGRHAPPIRVRGGVK